MSMATVPKVLALGAAGFREVLHQKLFYGIVVFAVGFVVLTLALVHLTIGQWERLITNVGVSAVGIASSLIAVFMGASAISREVERKTLYFVLSKPLSRVAFVASKFVAVMLVLVANAAAMVALIAGVLAIAGYACSAGLVAAAVGSLLEAAILAALAVMFSAMSTATLASVFTGAFFVIGHVASELQFVASRAPDVVKAVARVVWLAFPNFALVNFKPQAVNAEPVAWSEVGIAALYAAGYVAIALAVACVLFQRRDLK